ncbi:MAG: phosphatase PAP2 family protein [Sulfurifustaceae bacterium]
MKAIFYDWGGWNVRLFHMLNDVRGGFVDAFMQFGTDLGDHALFPLYLVAALGIAWWRYERAYRARGDEAHTVMQAWFAALTVFAVAYVLDGLAVSWLKDALDFPRPPQVLAPDALHVVGEARYRHSLPSGHALFAATLALCFWPVSNAAARVMLAMFMLWVGVSRVNLGAHFPADVLAGYLLAAVVVVPSQWGFRNLPTLWSTRTIGD